MNLLTMITPAEGLALAMLIALIVYALLGGADYGAGVWDLLASGRRAEAQRELIARAIGPVWEANHVWLIVVIVLLFTGFPRAFSAVMIALHFPLSLMLIGVVLRGSAFAFRSHDATELARRRWNPVFSVPSVLTPALLGAVIGAIATGEPGRAVEAGGAVPFFSTWLRPFPLVVGVFALNLFAYLAAVYLTLETSDSELREDFRLRALVSAITLGGVAWVVYRMAKIHAPLVYEGLRNEAWGGPLRYATGAFAVSAIVALWTRRYHLARMAAMVQAALILWGSALAQNPWLVPPHIDIAGSAAPPIVLKLLLIALGLGSLILVPSLVYLFRVFKGHTFAMGRRDEFGALRTRSE